MVSNKAKWNWSCYSKFGMDRLDRAKRKRKEDDIKCKCDDESSAKNKKKYKCVHILGRC